MKKYGNLIVLALVVMLAMSWFTWVGDTVGGAASYRSNYKTAQEKREDKLYQLSLIHFQEALNEKDGKKQINELADTCLEYYQDTPTEDVARYCGKILDGLMRDYPQNKHPYEVKAEICRGVRNFEEIKRICSRAEANHVKSEALTALREEIRYLRVDRYSNYENAMPACNGYYRVCRQEKWGLTNTSGDDILNCAADMLGPVSVDGYYVVTQGETSTIMNLNGIKYGNLDFTAQNAGVPNEGLVAIQKDGRYGYYTMDGTYLFGDYEDATTFLGGTALVKQDGVWFEVDTSGNRVNDVVFEDLVLTYMQSAKGFGGFVAKQDGVCRLFDDDLKPVGDFVCDQADMLYGDTFAFARDGLWGFADTKGNVVLEPQFEEAKSFCGNVACVKENGVWHFIDRQGNALGKETFACGAYLQPTNMCLMETGDANGWEWFGFVG